MRNRGRDQMVALQLRDIAMYLDDGPGRQELLAMADRLDPPEVVGQPLVTSVGESKGVR